MFIFNKVYEFCNYILPCGKYQEDLSKYYSTLFHLAAKLYKAVFKTSINRLCKCVSKSLFCQVKILIGKRIVSLYIKFFLQYHRFILQTPQVVSTRVIRDVFFKLHFAWTCNFFYVVLTMRLHLSHIMLYYRLKRYRKR